MIKKKKAVKKNLNTNEQNYVEVLLEDINSKFDFLVDSHQFLNQKVDTLDQKVDALDFSLNQKIDVIAEEIHLIRNDLKEKISRDEFILLEKRVIFLERAKTKA
ncbi:MAG: hypothetical protein HY773_00020 [Candidatus Terrybacteria bacterium]|nr:hypothetical protein [Candidatus Terrybacteria bacterium]